MKVPLHRGAVTIGLTGGIGSGKSTVAALLVAHGATLVDTDAIAHSLTTPGGAAMPALRQRFGDAVASADGALDRAHMRQLVFADPAAKLALEAILHPMIGSTALAQATAAQAATPGAVVVFDVPLLNATTAPGLAAWAAVAWANAVLPISGCRMASSASLAAGSANTSWRMWARASAPSALATASPKRWRKAGMAAPPGVVRLWAMASVSTSVAPCATSKAATVLVPLPMPPVRPIMKAPRCKGTFIDPPRRPRAGLGRPGARPALLRSGCSQAGPQRAELPA